MQFQKINDIKIKPFKVTPDIPIDKIEGGALFPLKRNIFICAKKNSGKTSIIGNILTHCANRMSTVFIICSTVNIDKTYEVIIKQLEKKKVTVMTYQSLVELTDEGRVNNLDVIMEYMRDSKLQEEQPEDDEKDKPNPIIKVDQEVEKKKRKPRPPKKLANKFFVVLDDLSNELHDVSIESFVKKNRHYDCCTIISNQSFIDLSPASRKQFDDVILLPGHQKDKLSLIYKDIDPPITLDAFLQLYRDATNEKYNFLNVSREGVFKKNFNLAYKLFK